jgi:hypothetical protein
MESFNTLIITKENACSRATDVSSMREQDQTRRRPPFRHDPHALQPGGRLGKGHVLDFRFCFVYPIGSFFRLSNFTVSVMMTPPDLPSPYTEDDKKGDTGFYLRQRISA